MTDIFMKIRESLPWKILLRIQEVIMVLCGAACCLLFVVEVVLRYVVKIDFLGYDEIVLFLAIWLYFIGGAYAMYKRGHISADMLSLVVSGRKLQFSHLFTDWITVIINVVMSIWGVDFFMYAIKSSRHTTVWEIPTSAAQAALTVGYILIALYALFYAIEDTVRYIKKQPELNPDELEELAEEDEIKAKEVNA